jgi:uncharacterized protein
MKRLALFAAFLMASNLAFAASFDCGKAHTRVEKLICGNKELSELDSELGIAYVSASFTDFVGRDALSASQKKWITSVRDRCSDVACLRRAYFERIDVLTLIETKRSEARYVVDQTRRSARTAEFQEQLKEYRVSGELTKCDLMVQVISREGGHDESYGAICNLDERPIMICNDTMIGKLTIRFEGFVIGGDAIAEFTEDNCPPGG